MRKVFEMGADSGAGVDGGSEENSRFEGWFGRFGESGVEIFAKKRPVFVKRTKGEVVRWNRSWVGGELRGEQCGDRWGRWMGALSKFIEKGADLGWEDGLDDLHEGATFWAAARIATEGGFEELVPRDAYLLGKDLGLFEQGVRQGQERAAETVGEEAVIANDSEVEVRDMRDQAGDENQNGECEGGLFLGVMIEVFEGDLLSVVGQDPGFAQGWALEVAAEVFGGGAVVVGVKVEMNDPFFSVKMIEPRVERAVIAEVSEPLWELQPAEAVLLTEEVDDLIPPHGFELFMVEKAFVEPALAILGKPPDGGGKMEVKIAVELASESVAGLENAGVEALLARQLQDEVGGQGWDEIEEVAVAPEELPQQGGHGEGDVLPGGVRQNIEVGFDPFIGGLLSARRAEAGLAGMGNGFGRAAGETPLKMSSQQHGLAGHHFEHVDEDAVPELVLVPGGESFPPISKNHSQADFATDKFHAHPIERKISRRKEKVAASAA